MLTPISPLGWSECAWIQRETALGALLYRGHGEQKLQHQSSCADMAVGGIREEAIS